MSIQIDVIGIPRPGGSKTPGRNRKTGKLFVKPANENTAVWRSDVTIQTQQQYKGELLACGLEVTYEFRMPRPKSHYRTGKLKDQLRPDAPTWHTNTPDTTKLIRSTEDALTSLVWEDDQQVAIEHAVKRYCDPGERPGALITITEIGSFGK